MAQYSEYKDSGQVWLGNVPSHWNVDSMKHCFGVISQKGRPDLPRLCSTQKYGVIPQSIYENRVVSALKALDTLKVVSVGDFVISLRSFQGGIEYAYYEGIISPAYTILRPKEPNNSYFFKYLLKSPVFISLLQSMVTGIIEGQNIDYNKLKYEYIPIPPQGEQEAIVAYLDKVTAEIDKAVEAKERIIASLEERRKIIITQAVTHGINPDVPMRDSGIDWLGEIPTHWEVVRIKYLLNKEKARSLKGKEEPLSMSQRHGLIPTKEMDVVPNLAASFENAKLVNKGNLVFNKLKAHLGVFSVSKYDGLVSPDYAVYSSTGRANLTFLEFIFNIQILDMERYVEHLNDWD